ncbi:MAG TPA: hypothetical protein VKT20_01125 [Candidatus Dormibacteraeota bacterium]|nr:hypothetical protein [Candidatus Dormibacteraeota bacterium]
MTDTYHPYPGKIISDFATLKREGKKGKPIWGAGDYRGPNTTFTFDGERRARFACEVCGTENLLELRSQGAYQRGYCKGRKCRKVTNQERVR